MRVSLGSAAALALAAAALSACGDGGVSQAQASAEPQGVRVTAIGCPVPGQQPGCLTMTSKGTLYDVSSAGIDLTRGVNISLTGRAGGETSACGAKLADVEFTYLSIQCGMAPTVDYSAPLPAAKD
jgi:hypothetical protein